MVYSESRSETDLLNDLEESKRVLLLGCPVCSNSSLYIQKAADGSDMLVLTPTGYKAVSVGEEVDRLTRLLIGKGFYVDSWVGEYPAIALCVLEESVREGISKKYQDFDTIVTISCNAGKKSIEGILPGKRIIPAMKDKGIMNAVIIAKEKDEIPQTLYIDKSTVNIARFTFDTQA